MGKKQKKILIKGVNWVGDTIMTLPAIEGIRKLFPESCISILVKEQLKGLFEANPHLSEVITYRQRKRFAKILEYARVINRLRKEKFDLCVLFPNSLSSALIAFLAGIKERIGYKTDGRGLLLTGGIKRNRELLKKNQVEYYLEIVGQLGKVSVSTVPHLETDKESKLWAEKLLSSRVNIQQTRVIASEIPRFARDKLRNLVLDCHVAIAPRHDVLSEHLSPRGIKKEAAAAGPVPPAGFRENPVPINPAPARRGVINIGINPGSTYGPAKRWLPERFAGVGKRLVSEHKARILLFGQRQEKGLSDFIAGRIGENCLNLAGKTTLAQLAALLERCNLLLTNDTGPMHIAAALGVPVIAVFGPTDPRTTAPAGEKHIIVRKPVACSPCLKRRCPTDHQCMKEIGVEDVFNAALKLLGKVNIQ